VVEEPFPYFSAMHEINVFVMLIVSMSRLLIWSFPYRVCI